MKYYSIYPWTAERGDIIKVKAYHINPDGTRPKWQFLKVMQQPRNNGSYIAKDSHGRRYISHLSQAVQAFRKTDSPTGYPYIG